MLVITGLLLDLLSGSSKSKAAPQGRMSWEPKVTPGRGCDLREVGWAEQGAGDRVHWQSQTGQGGESGSESIQHRRQDWREGYHQCQGSIQKTGLETCTPPAVFRTGQGASPKLTWSPSLGQRVCEGFQGGWTQSGPMSTPRTLMLTTSNFIVDLLKTHNASLDQYITSTLWSAIL